MNTWFIVLFGLRQEKLVFLTESFFAGLSNLLFSCPEEHLQSNVSERKSWKLKDFWINFEVFGTMAEKFFQGCHNSNRCPGEELIEKRFQKRKNHFFFDSERFCNLSEKFARSAKSANYVSVENFWGKLFAKTYKIFHTSLVFEPKKSLVGIFFLGCHNCNPRVQWHFLIKSYFSGKNYICSSVLEFEQLFLSFDSKKSGCQRNNLLIQKKNWRKEFVEKSFFKTSSDFQRHSLNN